MAVGVFAFRVTEPTCKNLGGASGNKRVVTAHKGFRALRTGSRRAKVEISTTATVSEPMKYAPSNDGGGNDDGDSDAR